MMTQKKVVLLFFLFIVSGRILAQNPNLTFAKSMGGTGWDSGNSIVTDPAGNSYITGRIAGTADMDPSAGVANLVSSGMEDVFVAKYDVNGAYLWAFKIGGAASDIGYSIALDASGNIFVTGLFSGTADFNPGAAVANLISSGLNDVFVAKYSSSGAYQWAFKLGSSSADTGWGVCTDASGNCYVTGHFSSTIDFDPSPAVTNLTSAGSLDAFVAKYDGSGAFQWAFKLGDAAAPNGLDMGRGIACDPSGNCYVTGTYTGTVDFDPSPATNTLVSASGYDIYIAKYSTAGAYQWAIGITTNSYVAGWAITTDSNGNCFLTGQLEGSADFDPSPAVAMLTAPVWQDLFVAKYTTNGAYQWAFGINSSFYGAGQSIVADAAGDIYLTGYFGGTSDFDPSAAVHTVTSVSVQDAVVAKYTGAGALVWAFDIGSQYSDIGFGISIDAIGAAYVTGHFSSVMDFDPGVATSTLLTTGGVNGQPDIFLARYYSCPAPGAPANVTPPVNASFCAGGSATLSASGTGTISWYSSPTAPTAIATGSTYITPVLSPGTYTYYTEASTCTTSATRGAITLTVFSLPTLSITSSAPAICAGQTSTLTAAGAASYSWNGIAGSASQTVSPPATSIYTLVGTDANSCSGQALFTQSVMPLPLLNASTSSAMICAGQTAVLTASGAISYTWNGIAGNATLAINPASTSVYTLAGTNADNCTAQALFTQNVSLCTGLSREAGNDALLAYPNPGQGQIILEGAGVQVMHVMNNLGQETAFSVQYGPEKNTIDLQNAPAGIYFILVKQGAHIKTVKVIRE